MFLVNTCSITGWRNALMCLMCVALIVQDVAAQSGAYVVYEVEITPDRSIVYERDKLLGFEEELGTSGAFRMTLDPDPFQSASETGTVEFSSSDVLPESLVLPDYLGTYQRTGNQIDFDASSSRTDNYSGRFDGSQLSIEGTYCEPTPLPFCYDFELVGSARGVGPPLAPGDADQDLDFDQFDIVQVQQSAKYLSEQSATWGEGDWNGAPGGYPGHPPPEMVTSTNWTSLPHCPSNGFGCVLPTRKAFTRPNPCPANS